MIRRPPRSTPWSSSAASDVYKRQGPWFTSIEEDGRGKGAHQSYLGTERNTLVISNWVQPCQCCCCLCYPGEYLRLGTHIRYNWAQVLEACDSLKLLSIYLNLCVDATGVVCHQLDLLGTYLHTVGVEALSRHSTSSSSAKPSMSSAKWRLVIALPPVLTVP